MGYRELTGFTVEEIEPGEAVGHLTVTEDHLNRGGIMHGGAIATLCDSAMGRAVMTASDPDHGGATASMHISYLASAVTGDVLAAHAKVRKPGRTTVVVEADVVREGDGRPIAHAISTFIVRPRRLKPQP